MGEGEINMFVNPNGTAQRREPTPAEIIARAMYKPDHSVPENDDQDTSEEEENIDVLVHSLRKMVAESGVYSENLTFNAVGKVQNRKDGMPPLISSQSGSETFEEVLLVLQKLEKICQDLDIIVTSDRNSGEIIYTVTSK